MRNDARWVLIEVEGSCWKIVFVGLFLEEIYKQMNKSN